VLATEVKSPGETLRTKQYLSQWVL